VLLGDFLSIDAGKDFPLAGEGVRELMALLKPTVTLAIPGNHDVAWTSPGQVRPFLYYDLLMDAIGLPESKSEHFPRVIVLPATGTDSKPLALVALNSCVVDSEEMAGIGYFGDDQISRATTELDRQGITADTHHIIAIAHHHVLPIQPKEGLPAGFNPRQGPRPKVSYTVDGIELLRVLVERRALAVCHGHDHRPALVRYQNQLWSPNYGIEIVVNGTCAARGETRQFFVLDLRDSEVIVHSLAEHVDTPASFEVDRRWAAVEVAI
jgi:hypothetical protein